MVSSWAFWLVWQGMYKLNSYEYITRSDERMTTKRFLLSHRGCYSLLSTIYGGNKYIGDLDHIELVDPNGTIILYWDSKHGLWYSALFVDNLKGQDALVSQICSVGKAIAGKIIV